MDIDYQWGRLPSDGTIWGKESELLKGRCCANSIVKVKDRKT